MRRVTFMQLLELKKKTGYKILKEYEGIFDQL
ncbi:hypothetical protein DJ87_4748 [Bacillus cereus]|nr:hypothetical protein DJ87_4748 [Bacillus cereus]